MNKRITDINILKESFATLNGQANGIYWVKFNNEHKLFIKNGESIGVVCHYLGESAMTCVSPIRKDVKEEFLKELKELKNIKL